MGLEKIFPDFETLRAAGFPGIVCSRPVVMIAMTPRTGSTHLCSALHAAGLTAEPTEIFNPRGPAADEAARRSAITFAAYVAAFASVPDRVFIFKTSWQDFSPFADTARHIFPDLQVVYLDRWNIAAQAVSDFRAKASNLWHRRVGQPLLATVPTPDFDLERIMQLLWALQAEKCAWEAWFEAQCIAPIRLRYEDFENDVNVALATLAKGLSVPLRTDLPPGVGLEKLADATSRDWTLLVQKRLLNMS